MTVTPRSLQKSRTPHDEGPRPGGHDRGDADTGGPDAMEHDGVMPETLVILVES